MYVSTEHLNLVNVNLYHGGSCKLLVLTKKGYDENQKKERNMKKRTGALYKLSQRSERGRPSLKQRLMDYFIIGDIDSIKIEGTFNILNLYRRGKGMVFRCRNAKDCH